MMAMKKFRCYAYGTDSDWQAICVDLDIAVQGQSMKQVMDELSNAVRTFIEDAEAEAPDVAQQLLNRRAPLYVRIKHALRMAYHMIGPHGENTCLTVTC